MYVLTFHRPLVHFVLQFGHDPVALALRVSYEAKSLDHVGDDLVDDAGELGHLPWRHDLPADRSSGTMPFFTFTGIGIEETERERQRMRPDAVQGLTWMKI